MENPTYDYVNSLFEDEDEELTQAEAYMQELEDEEEQDPVVEGPKLPMPTYQPPLYYGQQRAPQVMQAGMPQQREQGVPQLNPQVPKESLLTRLGQGAKAVGSGVKQFGKDFVTDLNVLEEGIGGRERAYRAANVGAFFIPPLKIGQTAALGARMAVRGLEAGAVTGALSAIRGNDVVPHAATGAGIGAGIEGLLGKWRAGRVAGKAAQLAARFKGPELFDKAVSPLRNSEWAVVSASLTNPGNVVLRPEANAKRTADLLKELRALGYDPIPAKGFAPKQAEDAYEDVFMVPGMTRRHALELSKKYEQQGLLTNEGFFDLDRATLAPLNKGKFKVGDEIGDESARTEINGQRFALGFDEPVDISGSALKPRLSDAEDKMESMIDRQEKSMVDKALSLPSRFSFQDWYVKTVRSFAEVEKMEKFLGTGLHDANPRLDGMSPSQLAQLSASWSSFAQHSWDYGIPAWNDRTQNVAPGLGTLFGRLKAGDHEAFERYGFARRMLSLNEKEIALPPAVTRDDLLDIINDNNVVNPHFGGVFDDMVNWRNKYIHETLVKPGVISEEAYKAITSQSLDYVPLRKVFSHATEQMRHETFPNSKILSDPIDRIGSMQGRLKPWTEELVKDMYSFSKLAHQQDFVLSLIRELEANDPTAANLFAQKVKFPQVELSKMQQEALASIADSDPELARAAAATGVEALGLLAPQKLMQRGLIGGLVPTKVRQVIRNGNNLGDIELLKAPAVKVGDKVFQAKPGEMHAEAVRDAIKDYASRGETIPLGPDGHRLSETGYVTSSGRFVTRKEALEVASKYIPDDMEFGFVPGLGSTNAIEKMKWFDSSDLEALNKGLKEQEVVIPQRQWYKVTNPNLWEGLQAMNTAQMGTFTKLAAGFASVLRAGATLSFEFMARNPIKDSIYATVAGGAPIHNFIGGFAHAFKQDEVYKKWLAAGGGRATMLAMDRESISKAVRHAAGITSQTGMGKLWNVVKSPVEALQILSDFMESGSRLGVYDRKYKEYLANGMNPEKATRRAALDSRNVTVDFSVHGSRTQTLRMITAFWNAQIQGYDNLRRAFQSDPVGASQRALMMITVPSTLLYLANRHDPEYFDLPSWERDMFWHVKIPEGMPWAGDKWVRLPKPFDLGVVFGSSVERYMQFVDQNDPKQLDAMMGDHLTKTFGDLMPIPTVARPLIENAINKSFLRNRPIESRALADVDPAYRIQPGTSELAQKLGEWLGESPVKIDNLFGGYSGGLGRLGVDIIDAGIAASEGRAPIPQRAGGFDPRDIPGLRGLFSQYPRHSDSVDRFYEMADEVRQAEQTRAYLQRTMQFDDLADWLEHKALFLGAAEPFREIQEQLKALRQQRDLILRDKTMSSAERGRQLDVLSDAMNAIASATLPMQQVLRDEE